MNQNETNQQDKEAAIKDLDINQEQSENVKAGYGPIPVPKPSRPMNLSAKPKRNSDPEVDD